eukprot:6513065-Prymnesium_polylepis.1
MQCCRPFTLGAVPMLWLALPCVAGHCTAHFAPLSRCCVARGLSSLCWRLDCPWPVPPHRPDCVDHRLQSRRVDAPHRASAPCPLTLQNAPPLPAPTHHRLCERHCILRNQCVKRLRVVCHSKSQGEKPSSGKSLLPRTFLC